MAEVGESIVKHYRPEKRPAESTVPTMPFMPERGGRKDGSDPTRFGDWEKQGRCIDF